MSCRQRHLDVDLSMPGHAEQDAKGRGERRQTGLRGAVFKVDPSPTWWRSHRMREHGYRDVTNLSHARPDDGALAADLVRDCRISSPRPASW